MKSIYIGNIQITPEDTEGGVSPALLSSDNGFLLNHVGLDKPVHWYKYDHGFPFEGKTAAEMVKSLYGKLAVMTGTADASGDNRVITVAKDNDAYIGIIYELDGISVFFTMHLTNDTGSLGDMASPPATVEEIFTNTNSEIALKLNSYFTLSNRPVNVQIQTSNHYFEKAISTKTFRDWEDLLDHEKHDFSVTWKTTT